MVLMIATVRLGNRKFGYKLIDTDTRECMELTTLRLKRMMLNGLTVNNLTIDSGSIRGSQGSESRYTVVDKYTGEAIGRDSLVILCHTVKGTYIATDFKGNIMEYSVEDLSEHSIANGRLHVGNRVIPIRGNYKLLRV